MTLRDKLRQSLWVSISEAERDYVRFSVYRIAATSVPNAWEIAVDSSVWDTIWFSVWRTVENRIKDEFE